MSGDGNHGPPRSDHRRDRLRRQPGRRAGRGKSEDRPPEAAHPRPAAAREDARVRDRVDLVDDRSGGSADDPVGDRSRGREGVRSLGPRRRPWAVETVVGDLRDADSLRRACEGVDVLIHCASAIGADEESARRVNDEATRALVDAAVRAGVTRIVALSTASVHGRGPFRPPPPAPCPWLPARRPAVPGRRARGTSWTRAGPYCDPT
ncbi:NAD-dependent epimerase/dehydratase family protein, partial [Streptomyces narbonensis]